MSYRNILVTGGAGFIGSNFVHHILGSYPEDRVTVVDNLTYAGNLANLSRWENDDRFQFERVDISDRDVIYSLLDQNSFTDIAHFAAESHVDRSILGPEDFVRTNVLGTFYLLEGFRRKFGKNEKPSGKFLHVSTDEVYGTLGEGGFFTEESNYQPNSPYSATKAGSDHLARAYFHTYGLPIVTSNCSNNYGPYQFPEKLIPLMILNCLNGKALPVYGEGKNIRDWLHVNDHCSALDIVLQKGRPGETYNIGSRNEKTNIEIVRLICSIMDEKHPDGAPHENLITYVKDRLGHDFRYAIDSSKIENELGWKPKYSFDRGIRDTIEWYLENRLWWEKILSGEYQKYYAKQYGVARENT